MLSAVLGLVVCVACDYSLPPKTTGSKAVPLPVEPQDYIAPVETGRILVVHSYNPEYLWCQLINRGLSNGWSSTPLDVQYYYMDTKRNTSEAWKKQAGEKAISLVNTYHPDVLVLADDDAQQYVGTTYVDGDLPVVFCGVNADPSKYGYPARNVTGFIERPPLEEGLAFLELFKPCRRIAFLSNDDPTSLGAMIYSKNTYFGNAIVDWRLIDTFSGWKRKIEEYNETMDAILLYTYHTLRDDEGNYVEPSDVMAWTREHAKIPILTFSEFGVPDGAQLGVVESGVEFGERTADYVLRILSGISPDALPVSRNSHFRRMINVETARKLNLECPPSLLEGVEVIGEN